MKITLVGEVTKVMPASRSTTTGKWKQDFVLTETGAFTNHFIIQVHAFTEAELEDIYIKGRVGAEVTCHCYLNGYRYNHKTHGESHGLRLVLAKIEP
jgi:hypothetical protein